MPVSRDLLLAVFGSFPTGVVVVATLDEGGAPKGLLCQAYVAQSADPPLALIAIDKSSRTLAAILRSGAFVINFLNDQAAPAAMVFSSKADDKFADIHWSPAPEAGGAPILFELATAFAACRVTRTIEAGDHWIFIASVEACEDLGGTPLIYWRRTYAGWPAESATTVEDGSL